MTARGFRVEHEEAGAVRPLGRLDGGYAHPSALEPFVGRLLAAGQGGTLVLVDEATGRVVARRAVRPFRGRPGRDPARPGA